MSKKVLTVDDSKMVRMIIKRALRDYDCTLCEAGNGQEGFALALTEKPDLIILDITMPVMDGLTMLAKIREDASLKTTPVIMLSAESGQDSQAQAIQLGASGYVFKPFKEEALLEQVGKIGVLPLKAAA